VKSQSASQQTSKGAKNGEEEVHCPGLLGCHCAPLGVIGMIGCHWCDWLSLGVLLDAIGCVVGCQWVLLDCWVIGCCWMSLGVVDCHWCC